MFKRVVHAVAMVAAVHAQQYLQMPHNRYGDSANQAGECSGTFGDSQGSFFIGVASITDQENDWLVGWGQGLCDTGRASSEDWTGDYSIGISDSDGRAYATGLSLTCPKTGETHDYIKKGLEGQIGNKKATKSLGDLEQILYDGEVIYVNSIVAQQDGLSN